jgi:hypothetical protein
LPAATYVQASGGPETGLPGNRSRLTLPPRCPDAATVSSLTRQRIAGLGQAQTATGGRFWASDQLRPIHCGASQRQA